MLNIQKIAFNMIYHKLQNSAQIASGIFCIPVCGILKDNLAEKII